MAFFVSALLLAGFIANVTVGAVSGTPWVGTVTEMLVLFGAAISFVVAILQREAVRDRDRDAGK